MAEIDYIIVGQGLAGTNLAFHLLEAGNKVIIVDKFREITSSKVAAGLMNPVTGRRFAKTWLAEKLFPFADNYYSKKEIELKANFFHKKPVYRYLGSVEDQNTWMGRSVDEEIKPYVGEADSYENRGINNDFGVAQINQGGWLDTNLFLSKSREYFLKEKILIDSEFNYEDLNTKPGIVWKDIIAKKIIFCEGFRSKDNPYFDWLPFTFAKGEILNIEIDGISENVIHNKNGFLLGYGNNKFKVGATFRWNEMDEISTERSLIELKGKLSKFTNLDYKITDQKASIRPTTKDRRPFIGCSKTCENVIIFNGFGSKGVTLTPYFANHTTSHLLDNTELDKEVDIKRFH